MSKKKNKLPTAQEAHDNIVKAPKVEGRVSILRALPYKDHFIYTRYIRPDYFEYLVVFGGQIYSSYFIITPRKGKKELTEAEIFETSALTWAAGEATIDMLLGVTVDEQVAEMVDKFENVRSAVEIHPDDMEINHGEE